MEEIKQVFNPFDKMTFSYENCFLCGTELSDENRTDEHIYPKWLQNKFGLWDKKLVILNRTDIRYKDLKIPCCKSCNQKMSSLFEKPIERAISGGYDELITLDKKLIFLWLNKMSYGMLFKELSLDKNRKEPEKGKIFTAEFLKENEIQYMFLQSILTDAEYSGNPYSILIFRIDPCESECYWAYDNPFLHTFCIRMNDIGIISNLLDNGYNEGFFLSFPENEMLVNKTLHPIQFAEISAKFIYKSSLFYRDPFYFMILDDEQKPKLILSQGISGNAYSDWSQEKYAELLAYFWSPYGLNFDDIYKGDDKVLSQLYQQDGSFNDLVGLIKESG